MPAPDVALISPFPPLGDRLEMLEEQLEIVTGLWTADKPFSYAGRHYQVKLTLVEGPSRLPRPDVHRRTADRRPRGAEKERRPPPAPEATFLVLS